MHLVVITVAGGRPHQLIERYAYRVRPFHGPDFDQHLFVVAAGDLGPQQHFLPFLGVVHDSSLSSIDIFDRSFTEAGPDGYTVRPHEERPEAGHALPIRIGVVGHVLDLVDAVQVVVPL